MEVLELILCGKSLIDGVIRTVIARRGWARYSYLRNTRRESRPRWREKYPRHVYEASEGARAAFHSKNQPNGREILEVT
jgi:hypothetical protein